MEHSVYKSLGVSTLIRSGSTNHHQLLHPLLFIQYTVEEKPDNVIKERMNPIGRLLHDSTTVRMSEKEQGSETAARNVNMREWRIF